MAGARFIMTVDQTAQLTDYEAEGTQCWDNEAKLMMVFDQGGWRALTSSPGDIFAIATFDSVKAVDVLDIPETYTPVATLTTPARVAGEYLLGLTLTYSFADTNNSAYLRFRIDGGVWNETIREPQDATDRTWVFYQYPAVYGAGVRTVEIEARKETAGSGQLDIFFCDIYFQRVG